MSDFKPWQKVGLFWPSLIIFSNPSGKIIRAVLLVLVPIKVESVPMFLRMAGRA